MWKERKCPLKENSSYMLNLNVQLRTGKVEATEMPSTAEYIHVYAIFI